MNDYSNHREFNPEHDPQRAIDLLRNMPNCSDASIILKSAEREGR